MKILEYLKWFGEEVTKPGTVLYVLANAIQKVIDAVESFIGTMTKQIYLMSATDTWLDRWGWDLARLKRQVLESDDAFRARILLKLFRVKGTRPAIREAVKLVMGSPPVEVFEPIRDTAYWNAGFYSIPRPTQDVTKLYTFYDDGFADTGSIYLSKDNEPTLRAAVQLSVSSNLSAAKDGTGNYCAKLGSESDSSYTGYVKVYAPDAIVSGDELSFYDSLSFLNATQFYGAATRKVIKEKDILDAVQMVKQAGTQVFVEFIQ